MRPLVFTQAVDTEHNVLGFFNRWLEKLAQQCETVTTVCLYKGHHELPPNVKVLSLGKEKAVGKAHYLFRFYQHLWRERASYDVVLVHMTPVYVLLGWPFWRVQRRRILLWYNHPVGTILTKVSIWIADAVLYTSPHSFAARSKKGRIMPAGIPTDTFMKDHASKKEARSILCLGRLSPAKRIGCLIEAAKLLDERHVDFRLRIVGSPARPGDEAYEGSLHESAHALVQKGKVTFHPAVRNVDTPKAYNQSLLLINLSAAGHLDKTILEAMACETLVLVSSRAFENVLPSELRFKENNPNDLANKILRVFDLDDRQKNHYRAQLSQYVVDHHSLDRLIEELIQAVGRPGGTTVPS